MHPYLQNIDNKKINFLCKKRNIKLFKNFNFIISSAIGTKKIYKINPLEVAFRVSETFKNSKIVLSHFGGFKILEAINLMKIIKYFCRYVFQSCFLKTHHLN